MALTGLKFRDFNNGTSYHNWGASLCNISASRVMEARFQLTEAASSVDLVLRSDYASYYDYWTYDTPPSGSTILETEHHGDSNYYYHVQITTYTENTSSSSPVYYKWLSAEDESYQSAAGSSVAHDGSYYYDSNYQDKTITLTGSFEANKYYYVYFWGGGSVDIRARESAVASGSEGAENIPADEGGYVQFTSTKTTNASGTMDMRIYWTRLYDEKTNTSTVSIDSIEIKSNGSYGTTVYGEGYILINDQVAISMSANGGTHGKWLTQEFTEINGEMGSVTLPHNPDGTLTLNIGIGIRTTGDWDEFLFTDTSSPVWRWHFTPAYKTIEVTSNKRGLVYIGDGSTFNPYLCYIGDGTNWNLYIPYVGDGTNWNLLG